MPVTKYLWDDESDTVVMEKNGAGDTTAVYHTHPGPFGKLVSQRRDGKTYTHHYDAQGNTRALTDETGQITDTYRYDAWGTQRAHTGTTKNPYRWGGQHGYQYNEATDDYYMRERVYEPKQSRWKSKDPLRFADGLNPYIYAANGPVDRIDPSGNASEDTLPASAFYLGLNVNRRVPKYNKSAVSACNALFLTIRDNRLVRAKYPCAQALIKHFLSKKGGTACPTACKSAVRSAMTRHFGNHRGNALDKLLFGGCAKIAVQKWQEKSLFKGSVNFKTGDLFYGLHLADFVFRGAGHLVCGAGHGDPCCCKCYGGATLEGSVTDTYDFCSSLPKDAVPPWKEKPRWFLIPSAKALAWCGCVLEDWYKKGTPGFTVGGKKFKVDCPVRLGVKISGKFCEKPKPKRMVRPNSKIR